MTQDSVFKHDLTLGWIFAVFKTKNLVNSECGIRINKHFKSRLTLFTCLANPDQGLSDLEHDAQ